MSRYLIVVFGFLTGCAFYHPQPLSPEKTAAQLESRRLDDPDLRKILEFYAGHEIEWPKKEWDLQDLTAAAFNFQPSLQVALAKMQLAGAAVKTAGQHENPSVTVTPEYNTTTAVPSPWGPSASIDVPIQTMGKRGKRIAAAQHAADSARYDYLAAEWKIASDVRARLLDLASAEQRLAILQKQSAAQEQIATLSEQQFQAGEISRTVLTTAQMAFHRTRLELSDARSKHGEARVRLAQAVGVSVAALDTITTKFDFSQAAPETLTSVEARHIALLSRADILGALADYAETEDNLRLEIAKQYPDLHLSPGYQYDQGDNKWSVGLTLELPLLNQNQGPIAEAKMKRKLAAARFVELQSRVIADIDAALANYQAAEEQLKTAETLLTSSDSQHQFALAQGKAGAADALDVQNAELEFNSAGLAHLDSQAKFQAALGTLEDALQRPAGVLSALSGVSLGKETQK